MKLEGKDFFSWYFWDILFNDKIWLQINFILYMIMHELVWIKSETYH